MKRTAALVTVMVMLCSTLVVVTDAWARAGGGGSKGSRGSRSYTAPARPSSTPSSPSTPAAPVSPSTPQRSGWSGLMGGLGGLMLGGLLGGLLFGGLFGGGFGGGFGMLDLLILGVLGYVAYSWYKRRQVQPAAAPGYASASGYAAPPAWAERTAASAPQPAATGATAVAEPAATGDLARGLDHIRQVDAAFDPRAFAERAAEIFRDVQGAWTRQDLSAVSGVLTPEMLGEMQKDGEAFRAEGKVNHLDQITVRAAEVTEAWQEKGQDFVTVRFQASLVDYTTDRQGKVVDGNPNEPIAFEEYWTFSRPVWAKSWRLTAIQQPAGR